MTPLQKVKIQIVALRGTDFVLLGAAYVFQFIADGTRWVESILRHSSGYLRKLRLEIEPDDKPLRWRESKEASRPRDDIVDGYQRNSQTTGSSYNSDLVSEDTSIIQPPMPTESKDDCPVVEEEPSESQSDDSPAEVITEDVTEPESPSNQ